MRVFLLLIWGGFIFICTCTSDFNILAETGEIRFLWDSQPDFSELLLPLPEELNSAFILQKSGHIIAFLVLTVLLLEKIKSQAVGFALALICAVFTEFLQLYFGRDGRLFDIGIDTVGIFLALGICTFIIKREMPQIAIREQSN